LRKEEVHSRSWGTRKGVDPKIDCEKTLKGRGAKVRGFAGFLGGDRELSKVSEEIEIEAPTSRKEAADPPYIEGIAGGKAPSGWT